MESKTASLAIRPVHGGHASAPSRPPKDDAVKPLAILSSPYDEVHALMIDWEEAGKETSEFREQKEKLADEFRKYRFNPESFEIPSKKPYQALLMRIQQFLDHDRPRNLLIIYYGGHGANNKDKEHIWYCRNPNTATSSTNPNPKINWTSIQGLFQDECEAHVLFILDCCYSAAVARYVHASSTVEAMVAAGFERVAPLRGAHSFTMFLLKVLKDMRAAEEAAYADVVCRMVSAQLNRTDPAQAERSIRATPHHIPFANKADKIIIGINHGVRRSVEDTPSTHPVSEGGFRAGPAQGQSGEAVRGPMASAEPEATSEEARDSGPRVVTSPGGAPREGASISHIRDTSSAAVHRKGDKKSRRYDDDEGYDIPVGRPRRTYTGFSARLSASILDQFPTEPEEYGSTTTWHPVFRPLRADQVRLLHLQPSKNINDPLISHLTVGSLFVSRTSEELPDYEALSWHWGNSGEKTELYLFEGENHDRHPIQIPISLDNALRSIRNEDDPKTIWVDYICVPRFWSGITEIEVHRQLKLLPIIFEKASHVIVWLGEADENSQTAMEFAERVAKLEQLNEVIKSDDTPKHWDTLVSLMRRPWFTRRWVFQEIIIARRASIFCGSHNIPWDTFSDAVTLLGTCFDDVQYRLRRQEISNSLRHTFENLVDLRALEAYSVVEAGKDLFRRQGDGSILSTCSLEALVSALPALQSANPHDIIYALFPISTDSIDRKMEEDPFDLDYRQGESEVFQNFVRYCVETSKSLDIICRPWAPNQDNISNSMVNRLRRHRFTEEGEEDGGNSAETDRLPSWICQVRNLPFGHRRKNIYGRKNGDVLVGYPNRRIYNASRRSAATPLFGRAQPDGRLVMDGTMVASGFPLGKIDEIGFRAAAGTIYMEWIEMCDGWTTSTGARPKRTAAEETTAAYVPDHLWRTLVADRGPNGTPTPTWYHRACQYWLEYSEGQDVTYDVIQRDQHPATALDYIQRVQSVIWDRRLFKIHRLEAIGRALYGLAPRGAREGDTICILHGCSVPVVLRATKNAEDRARGRHDGSDSSNNRASSWELIGECFVYGMMDGEAMEVEDFLGGTREFEIC